MNNATMYCVCTKNKTLPLIKNLGYVPVGLGNDKFSAEWIKDDTLENISFKNKSFLIGHLIFNSLSFHKIPTSSFLDLYFVNPYRIKFSFSKLQNP